MLDPQIARGSVMVEIAGGILAALAALALALVALANLGRILLALAFVVCWLAVFWLFSYALSLWVSDAALRLVVSGLASLSLLSFVAIRLDKQRTAQQKKTGASKRRSSRVHKSCRRQPRAFSPLAVSLKP